MESACRAAGKSCVGDRALAVLFDCYDDEYDDGLVKMRDFECKQKCVAGEKGQHDYCSDSPAPRFIF